MKLSKEELNSFLNHVKTVRSGYGKPVSSIPANVCAMLDKEIAIAEELLALREENRILKEDLERIEKDNSQFGVGA